MARFIRQRLAALPLATLVLAELVCAGAVALVPAQPVLAQQSCFQDDPGKGANGTNWECRWTQLINSWPSNNYPSCSPCLAYGRGLTLSAAILQGNANNVAFHDDMANAVYAWSGQPYNSPWFNDCHCSSAFLNIGASNYGPGTCGLGGVTYDSNGAIVGAFANYNTAVNFVDSPNTAGTCDARSIAVHEVGHAFTEGHSSYPSDVMDWRDCQCATIDEDAQSMLNAVYGAYNNQGTGGCSTCQAICPSDVSAATPFGTESVPTPCPVAYGYLAKAWDLSHGVGNLLPNPSTNPVTLVTPSDCLPFYYAKEYVQWLRCMIP